MKVRCIYNKGSYWFAPHFKIKEVLELNKEYEVRDEGYYEEYSSPHRYLIATKYGSKNFPAKWFEII